VVQVQPADLLTVQDVRHRFSESCSHLLTSSPIVSFSPTSETSSELTNKRSAATLFKNSPVYLSLPLPANPAAKQRRPATSNVDRPSVPAVQPATGADARGKSGVAAGKDAATRARPKTAAAAPTFGKPKGTLLKLNA